MPTYALLGATGSTGSAVLRCLLAEPPKSLKMNIIVRSKARLLKAFTRLEERAAFQVTILEGNPTQSSVLQQCLASADVIINCIGTNESKPGTSICYDTTAAIIDSLKSLREKDEAAYHTPTILKLSAAPTSPIFSKQMPSPVYHMLHFCLRFAYEDLEKAAQLHVQAAKESPGLFDYIFLEPGALHDSAGTTKTGHILVTTGQLPPSISYADVGAGICEIAERREEFRGKGVGIGATGKFKPTWGENAWWLVSGFRYRLLHFVGMA